MHYYDLCSAGRGTTEAGVEGNASMRCKAAGERSNQQVLARRKSSARRAPTADACLYMPSFRLLERKPPNPLIIMHSDVSHGSAFAFGS